jgi:Protein of unknown function (DUF1559)/Domain of unknown function (DUF4190)
MTQFPDDTPAQRRQWEDEDDDVSRDESAPPGTSGKAIASLILGIASFVFWVFAGVPAIIVGALGLRNIGRSRGRLGGQGMAITGIVLGAVSAVVGGLVLSAVQKVSEFGPREHSMHNIRVLALAMHYYHDANGAFPPPVVYSKKTGRPLYSWRVLVLPYLEEDRLYKTLDLNEPWDSPRNAPLLVDKEPAVFRSRRRQARTADGTFYQVFVGNGALFDEHRLTRFADITDGPANTIMIVEAASDVPWASPGDLAYRPGEPVLPLLCGPQDSGFIASFADGGTRYISRSVSDSVLHKAITRAGNEVVHPDQDFP